MLSNFGFKEGFESICALPSPGRYTRDEDGGVSIPQLDGWSTGPLKSLRGKFAFQDWGKRNAAPQLVVWFWFRVQGLWLRV